MAFAGEAIWGKRRLHVKGKGTRTTCLPILLLESLCAQVYGTGWLGVRHGLQPREANGSTHGSWHCPDYPVLRAFWSLARRLRFTLDICASPGVPNGPVSVRALTPTAAMSFCASPRTPRPDIALGKYRHRWLAFVSSNWR